MNVKNSKSTVLLESVRAVLVGDTSNTGFPVREISHYVEQRIIQSSLPYKDMKYPLITMSVEDGDSGQILPTGTYWVQIGVWVSENMDKPSDTIGEICARVEYLLHNQKDNLNAKSGAKNLRCRMIVKESGIRTPDPTFQAIVKRLIFRVVCDDETVNC